MSGRALSLSPFLSLSLSLSRGAVGGGFPGAGKALEELLPFGGARAAVKTRLETGEERKSWSISHSGRGGGR